MAFRKIIMGLKSTCPHSTNTILFFINQYVTKLTLFGSQSHCLFWGIVFMKNLNL